MLNWHHRQRLEPSVAISPLEANLAWTINWQAEDREFIGRSSLKQQRENRPEYALVGLLMSERGVLRAGQTVTAAGLSDKGLITSGTFSPTLQQGIALARVPHAFIQTASTPPTTPQSINVEIRGKQIPVEMVKPPFVRHGKAVYHYYGQRYGYSDDPNK